MKKTTRKSQELERGTASGHNSREDRALPKNVLDILKERGFVEQVTNDGDLRRLLSGTVACYIGFDPTSASLHVGSLVPIMALVHMQRRGHQPIVVVGGGTALIGDPSGKTELRQVLTREQVDEHAQGIERQLSRCLEFGEGRARLLNNSSWLSGLNYIDFLRDIGHHFSVNRMLAAESYRQRLSQGLTFVEFNYMLLQAYDFLHLYRNYKCTLQMGGNDQWGNILAGTDLIRRVEGASVHGMTFPLLVTASGKKMGKTEEGTIWLDPEQTSPYQFYPYWINTDDRDVERFLLLFTLLPMDEIREFGHRKGSELRGAKEVLAFEVTKMVHGESNATTAREASRALFGGGSSATACAPTAGITRERLEEGIAAYILFEEVKLCLSRGEARRLIESGGGYVNGERIKAFDEKITTHHLRNDEVLLRAGKKKYQRIVVEG
jgi:tyrosyl-tRNA synthetase